MNYSDEQLRDGVQNGEGAEGKKSVKVDTDNSTMPKIVPNPDRDSPAPKTAPAAEAEESFAGELVSVIIKTVFLALSFIAMLACIIAVSIPLTTMRIFNSLGMSARAVDFGERYISGRLDEYGADATDEIGNYNVLSRTAALTDDDMTEALYVCINLSDKLMVSSFADGDSARVQYYAERLEKYTRMYLSLNGLSRVSIAADEKNIASMPSPALHPTVYSLEHDLRVLNYKARAYLGKTEYATFNNRSDEQGVMTRMSSRAEHFYGTESSTLGGLTSQLDDFTDYIGQLGAYLDAEFERIGVVHDFSKRYDVKVTVGGEDRVFKNVPIISETFVNNTYSNVLNGNEFSLFITSLKDADGVNNGFTRLYTQLKCFNKYAQWAVDTMPVSGQSELQAQLHRLYWLQTLSSVSQKLCYMELLLYYSKENLGVNSQAVVDEYGTCTNMSLVKYNNATLQISEVYKQALKDYIAQYQS